VLAGLLMLVALVLPFGASMGGFLAPDEGASALVVLAIAGGFVLGVVIDRAADSLLEGWLGYQRLRFATDERIAAERTRLVPKSVALADPFPENWMRDCLM